VVSESFLEQRLTLADPATAMVRQVSPDTLDVASGGVTPLLDRPGMQIAVPRWSPDGTKIAFIGGLMSDEPVPGGDIYVVSAIGSTPRNLTPDMKMTADSLDWAPDSKNMVVPRQNAVMNAIRSRAGFPGTDC